jgi:hypothetical protein
MLCQSVRQAEFGQWEQSARPGVQRKLTGDEIRAKIEENRKKRLAIGEAMKREAGVTGHEIRTHDDGGWARLETGLINAPDSENMRKLTTIAHECGHVFLHGIGTPGYRLPPHVMEMEAESYAHQAFLVHGMRIVKRRSDWGRVYVGTWVEKDRAKGVPIDPRVIEYVAGRRSPYAPLRAVPSTWHGVPTEDVSGVEQPADAVDLTVSWFIIRMAVVYFPIKSCIDMSSVQGDLFIAATLTVAVGGYLVHRIDKAAIVRRERRWGKEPRAEVWGGITFAIGRAVATVHQAWRNHKTRVRS